MFFCAPNGRCLITLKPLSTHGYGWITACSHRYFWVALLSPSFLTWIELRLNVFACGASGAVLLLGRKPNLGNLAPLQKTIINDPGMYFCSRVRSGICRGLWHESLGTSCDRLAYEWRQPPLQPQSTDKRWTNSCCLETENWLPYCCFESPPASNHCLSTFHPLLSDISIFFFFFATTCIKSFLKSVPDSCPQPVLHFSFRLRPARGNNRCRNRWCHGKEKGMIFSSWRVNWAMWLWRGELLPLVLDHHGTLFQKEMCKNFNR